MWILYAFLAALFAGITSIFAKIGIKDVDSHVLTALRTVVVTFFAWTMVFVVGSQGTIGEISSKTLLFLVLSGMTTGFSWIAYFRALQLGDVNKVVPIDKSSTVLTMFLAFLILGEPLTSNKLIAMVAIGWGTWLMIQKQKTAREDAQIDAQKEAKKDVQKETQKETQDRRWMIYAILSAVFAALTSILGKIGIEGVESNLGTAIRTVVVLIMAWSIVLATNKTGEIPRIQRKSWIFIGLSGLATGLSWMFYYHALQLGQASIVVPIDKLSILVTVLFAYVFLGERLTRRSLLGLFLIVAGTLLLLVVF